MSNTKSSKTEIANLKIMNYRVVII